MTDKPSWNLEPDTAIAEGRWILEHLGGGNRYEVFLVWDEKLFAPVVAKILRPDRVENPRSVEALRREAELLDRLRHPVLVRGFGAVLDGPYPHVLLEEVEGPTLRRLIRRHGALPLEQLLPLALHVAAALHYLSTESVVHFDVKPGNIVMSVPPRLLDLSLARSVDEGKQLRKPVGTHVFMAPEVCEAPNSSPRIGTTADIWSLGGTLYQAITGELPFTRDEEHAQLVEEPAPLRGQVPDGLASLVMRMLAKDPSERPPAREVAAVLESFAG
jgi:eukaryotic-like serine/threonine-protein kinase